MKHQIIYTYCENDFYTGEKGFGVSSASRGFPQKYREELLKRAKYIPPILPNNPTFTPELCEYMPDTFSYFKLHDVYVLGKVKLTGGTVDESECISHFVTVDGDGAGRYIEYALSPDFVDVAGSKTGAYCSDLKMRRGDAVNINKVMNFLSFPGRARVFEKMIGAALECKKNGGKIIISDKAENILMWIGAILYALPKKAADAMTFCTYAFDPNDCTEDICGVLSKMTEYSAEKVKHPDVLFDLLFDLHKEKSTNDEPADGYCAFIAANMAHDYRAVARFNEFTEQYFDFKEPTYDITVAYDIYSLLNGSVTSLSADTLKECIQLVQRSAPALSIAVSEKIVSQYDVLGSLEPTFMLRGLEAMCMAYPHASFVHKDSIRNSVSKCIFMLMLGQYCDEQVFETFYTNLNETANKSGFSLTDELMNTENRNTLVMLLTYKPSRWKTDFAVKLLSSYIIKNDVSASSISADSPLGAFIADIVRSGEKAGTQLDNAQQIISPLTAHCITFCRAYMLSQNALADLEGADENTEKLREKFAELTAASQLSNRNLLFDFLLNCEDYSTLYECYRAMMNACDADTAQKLYEEHCKKCFDVNADYTAEYFIRASEDYFAVSKKFDEDERYTCAKKIFSVISVKKIVIPSSQACIDEICSHIDLKSPSSESGRALIYSMNEYVRQVRGVLPTGRLQALVFGLECEKIDNKKEYKEAKDTLQKLTSKEKVDITGYDDDDWEDLLDWTLPIFVDLLLGPDEIEFVYDRFVFTEDQSAMFFEKFTKQFILQGKNESDYTELCKFLTFVYKRASVTDKSRVAEQIKKLNAKRIEMITATAADIYSDSPANQDGFSELMEIPVKKGGFFSGLFKKI